MSTIREVGPLTDRVSLTIDNADRGSCWARVKRMSAADDAGYSVTLRFRSDLKAGDSVQYRGRRLNIVSLRDITDRRLWLQCFATEAKAE